MKKRILSLVVIACLVLSLAACGGNTTSSEASSEAPAPASSSQEAAPSSEEAATAEETAPSEDAAPAEEETAPSSTDSADSDLPTLEEFFNSEIMQTAIDAAKEQYEGQGISTEMYAEGNELRYEFTVDDLETTEEDRAVLAETLQATTEAAADSFLSTASQAKSAVSNEEVVVVITYKDGAGNVLYTQSFSSADAE